jgi:hypothetical protein
MSGTERRSFMRFCISMLALVALAPAAYAADGVLTHPIRVDSRAAFVESSAHATGEMRPDGRYEFMSDEDRAQARALLAKIDSKLASSAAPASLADEEREVNELFERNDGNRKICEMKSSTGSNLPVKICRKAADVERRKRAAQAGGGSAGGRAR